MLPTTDIVEHDTVKTAPNGEAIGRLARDARSEPHQNDADLPGQRQQQHQEQRINAQKANDPNGPKGLHQLIRLSSSSIHARRIDAVSVGGMGPGMSADLTTQTWATRPSSASLCGILSEAQDLATVDAGQDQHRRWR